MVVFAERINGIDFVLHGEYRRSYASEDALAIHDGWLTSVYWKYKDFDLYEVLEAAGGLALLEFRFRQLCEALDDEAAGC